MSIEPYTFTIMGEPASKSNSRRLVRIKGVSRSIKSKKALDYCAVFIEQCPVLEELFSGNVSVSIHIYYASRRPDLDESLILDLMQGKIYTNDRQVKEKHILWGLDPKCPRSIITVAPMEVSPDTVG